MSARTCTACPKPIQSRNKTGLCRSCGMKARHADPVWREKQRAKLRATCQSEASRAKRSAITKARYADPAHRAKMAAAKKRAMADPVKRANVARAAAETLRNWHATTDRDWSAWHRDRHSRSVAAKEAARIERERWEAMTPFERQLARVAAGARLVAKPDLRKADPTYTMGGVATGQL